LQLQLLLVLVLVARLIDSGHRSPGGGSRFSTATRARPAAGAGRAAQALRRVQAWRYRAMLGMSSGPGRMRDLGKALPDASRRGPYRSGSDHRCCTATHDLSPRGTLVGRVFPAAVLSPAAVAALSALALSAAAFFVAASSAAALSAAAFSAAALSAAALSAAA